MLLLLALGVWTGAIRFSWLVYSRMLVEGVLVVELVLGFGLVLVEILKLFVMTWNMFGDIGVVRYL